MDVEKFKEKSIRLLEYCIAETKRVAEEDELKYDIESTYYEQAMAYCEGLQDAIDKIRGLEVE